ncbi:MAG: hypothetical protein ACQEVA_08075 [Myxococcota bacterium]
MSTFEMEDETDDAFSTLSGAFARLLDLILDTSHAWPRGRWVDSVLTGDARLENGTLVVVGTANFDAPEPNWNIELFNNPEATF